MKCVIGDIVWSCYILAEALGLEGFNTIYVKEFD